MQGTFKKEHSFEKRRELCITMKNRFPKRIPVIVEVFQNSSLKLDRKKFLTPDDISVGAFLTEIRKHSSLRPEEAMFLFCNNTILVPTGNTMGQLYEKYKDEDGFLYITVALENTFGTIYIDKMLDQVLESSNTVISFLINKTSNLF
jgi:GABA(A) receptor-associated protein